MKRLLIAAFLLCSPAYAGLATCKDGACSMKEEDYRQLQAFHKQTREVFEQMERRNAELEQALMQQMGNAANCRSRLPQKEV